MMTDQLSDLLHAGTDRVQPALPPPDEIRRTAERRRRRRAAAALVAVAVGVVMAGAPQLSQLRPSGQHDVVTNDPAPSPRPDRLVDDPFMDPLTAEVVRTDAAPRVLSSCVSSPLGWGAAESSGVRYVGLGKPATVYNEFVLRFDTVAEAHRAVTNVWRKSARCAARPGATDDPPTSPEPSAFFKVDEWFANQRAIFATEQRLGQPNDVYALRVGRRLNIVVVIEDRGDPDDRALELLNEALSTATGIRP